MSESQNNDNTKNVSAAEKAPQFSVKDYNKILVTQYVPTITSLDMSKVNYSDPDLQARLMLATGGSIRMQDLQGAYNNVKARMDFASSNHHKTSEENHTKPSNHQSGTVHLAQTISLVYKDGDKSLFAVKHDNQAMMRDFFACRAMSSIKEKNVAKLPLVFADRDLELNNINVFMKAFHYTHEGLPIDPIIHGQDKINQNAFNVFVNHVREVKDVKLNVLQSLPNDCHVMKSASDEEIKHICFLSDQPYLTNGTPIEIQRCFDTFAFTKLDGACPEIHFADVKIDL